VKDYLDWDGKCYACKVIRQNRHSTFSDISLERSAVEVISKGRHPNVVDILDTWIEETNYISTCFIQMELCQGDLEEFLQLRYQENSPGPPPAGLSCFEIWGIFRQILSGLDHIHSQGIIHRDFKPKNGILHVISRLMILVLYTKDKNGLLVWKITDFGSSAQSSQLQPITESNRLTNDVTNNYSAPEVIIGSWYDQKADIWSAGCILYELGMGRAPFSSEDEVREYAWSGKLIPAILGERGERVGRRVDLVVGLCLHVPPEMRPSARKILDGIPRDPQ
jgi:serine/threonine protein kinase